MFQSCSFTFYNFKPSLLPFFSFFFGYFCSWGSAAYGMARALFISPSFPFCTFSSVNFFFFPSILFFLYVAFFVFLFCSSLPPLQFFFFPLSFPQCIAYFLNEIFSLLVFKITIQYYYYSFYIFIIITVIIILFFFFRRFFKTKKERNQKSSNIHPPAAAARRKMSLFSRLLLLLPWLEYSYFCV